MSILIKGMEMPTNCEKCPFLDYEEGFCFASGVKHESGWYESTLCPGGIKNGRHDDCPLVPIPKHGRLIDADALAERLGITDMDCFKCAWGNHGFCGRGGEFNDACEAIDDALTIIPASEEGET